MGDLVSHVSSADLSGFNIAGELVTLGIKVSTHVSFSDTFVSKAGSFAGLLIKETSGISGLGSKSGSMVRLVSKEVLKVIKSSAGFTNFIGLHVKGVALVVLGSSSIIGKHSVATFHVEDLVVHTAVVSLLVSEVVKLLTELSNKLVLFT